MDAVSQKALFKLLAPQRQTSIVDIGANPCDGPPIYTEMLAAGICTVTGFEPLPSALAELNRRKSRHETYLPYVIGAGGERLLRVCAAEGMTSLLAPDPARLELFTDFSEFGKVVREVSVPTVRLDDVVEIDAIDFLKIDIQGAELEAVESGRTKLASAVVVQTEISFLEIYKEQPTFGHIDLTLRSLGFVPHCFAELKTWPLKPFRSIKPRQLLEGDIVYVRDFTNLANCPANSGNI